MKEERTWLNLGQKFLGLKLNFGVGTLVGSVNVCKPRRFEDTLASISGCLGPCLDLLNSAGSFDQFESALKLTFEVVKDSWRNSESFERENGFAILAWLLKQRLGIVENSGTDTLSFDQTVIVELGNVHNQILSQTFKFLERAEEQ